MNSDHFDVDSLRPITESVIGASMTVINEIGPGLSEKCYENALLLELIDRGHNVDQQRSFPVKYKGRLVGKLIPDLLVDNCLIVDAKVVDRLVDDHTHPMLTYLAVTQLHLAFLINFRRARLEWKRVIA